ncbi:hypothetical protein ABE561_22760 [Pseudomonas asiatica]|nr:MULTISPECIES: hypothetical protein [Pseudomonas]MDM9553152.1 hypothetical protein [Pseudomonas asiatica]
MAKDNAYYLDEALYISAQPPTGIELHYIGGGGGPGGGGWGLSDGYPRGTSPTKSDIARVISTQRCSQRNTMSLKKIIWKNTVKRRTSCQAQLQH